MTGARIDCRAVERDGDRRGRAFLPGGAVRGRGADDPQADLGPGRVAGPYGCVVRERLRAGLRDGPGQVDDEPPAGLEDVVLAEPEAEAGTPAGETGSESEGLGPDVAGSSRNDARRCPGAAVRGRRPASRQFQGRAEAGAASAAADDQGDRHQARQDRRGSADRTGQVVPAEIRARASGRHRLCAAVSTAPGE